MTVNEFKAACRRAYNYVKKRIVPNPKTRYITSTGNMALNAFKIEFRDGGRTCRVWIDKEIAPYVYYTNEPWVSPRWHGKKNPNEGWWDTLAKTFAQKVAQYLGGELR